MPLQTASSAPPSNTVTRPAWKEPLVWLVVGIPGLTIVAGLVTWWIAAQRADSDVADDHYRRGLAINRVLEREEAARAAQQPHGHAQRLQRLGVPAAPVELDEVGDDRVGRRRRPERAVDVDEVVVDVLLDRGVPVRPEGRVRYDPPTGLRRGSGTSRSRRRSGVWRVNT
ncbi:MAG: FixH family protein [Burkholderiales bacterium]|nr:FixH family protein [Burkholderiales bacterium]